MVLFPFLDLAPFIRFFPHLLDDSGQGFDSYFRAKSLPKFPVGEKKRAVWLSTVPNPG